MDATTCSVICGHPGCWATRRKLEKGLAKSLPPLELDDESSDEELNLPKQSICNILEDYGESPMDRYPLSTGGRPSHDIGPPPIPMGRFSAQSLDSGLNLGAPHNTTASVLSKQTRTPAPRRSVKRNPRLRLVEVQEVFDRDDLQAGWDETFVTKQYYVWMANPSKRRRKLTGGYKHETGVSTAQTNPVLMKDMTECMIPSEIEQRREETVLFDEWPVLKKKQPRTKSPVKISSGQEEPVLDGPIDREGINELLALPKDTLMKVLEHTKKSDFTSPGRLHSIVHQLAQDDERARLALGARHAFQHKEIQAANKRHQVARPGADYYYGQPYFQPVYQLDKNADEDHGIIDRLSSVNTPQRKKLLHPEPLPPPPPPAPTAAALRVDRPESEADSIENFPRYSRPLPGIQGQPKPAVPVQKVLHYRGKIPSVSLGLPELPSGLRTTKAFSYKRQDLDFSLGPVVTPPSSYRSSEGAAFSEHGTTLKVNISSTVPGMHDYREEDLMAIHCVSPALSTHVPVPPAGTPATAAVGVSPTKSAPAAPLGHQQYSWDTTRITITWSQNAQPPSRGEAGGDSAQVTRMLVTPQTGVELDGAEERALDTINETARENANLPGPAVAAADVIVPGAEVQQEGVKVEDSTASQKQEAEQGKATLQPPGLHLERSTLKQIGPAVTPRAKSAKSVESCPSPEQWPLISESSFEEAQRPSVSEPALSARSDRRRPTSRDNRRDMAARKALDDSKMKTESPAPPPPSPEPKDHAGEGRARKDLRSRDSLTMAPLFEVAEMDEGSPRITPRVEGQGQGTARTVGHMHSKKIEVTVPAERQTATEKEEEEGSVSAVEGGKSDGGEMISQMTVMHVIPKGRGAGRGERRPRELERVQETFLNVDIPAEDVSSIKAEHGSSHQEELSSTSGVGQGDNAGGQKELTPRDEVLPAEDDREQREADAVSGQTRQVDRDGDKEQTHRGDEAEREVTINYQEEQVGENGAQREEVDASPEMLCDSSRFVSHHQVSPVEGESTELDLGASPRFMFGEEVGDGSRGGLLGNLTRRLEGGSSIMTETTDQDVGGEEVTSAGDRRDVEGKEAEEEPQKQEEAGREKEEEAPPGVFFFQGSSPSDSPREVDGGRASGKADTIGDEKTKPRTDAEGAGTGSGSAQTQGEEQTAAGDGAKKEGELDIRENVKDEEEVLVAPKNSNKEEGEVATSEELDPKVDPEPTSTGEEKMKVGEESNQVKTSMQEGESCEQADAGLQQAVAGTGDDKGIESKVGHVEEEGAEPATELSDNGPSEVLEEEVTSGENAYEENGQADNNNDDLKIGDSNKETESAEEPIQTSHAKDGPAGPNIDTEEANAKGVVDMSETVGEQESLARKEPEGSEA